jgi:hypothetical protein
MSYNARRSITPCPCKDCEDRTVTCHGVCGRYQEWKKTETEKKEEINRMNGSKDTMSDAKKRAIWRKLRYSRQPNPNNHREL